MELQRHGRSQELKAMATTNFKFSSRFGALVFATDLFSQLLEDEEQQREAPPSQQQQHSLSPSPSRPNKSKRKATLPVRAIPPPQGTPVPLPGEFREVMIREGMTEGPILLIQKRLTATDLKKAQNRMSMPVKQATVDFFKFLKPSEEAIVNSEAGMTVRLIEPSRDVSTVVFKRWKMEKTTGRTSYMYVFNGKGWGDVKNKNALRESEEVQVWAFRVGDQLAHALVRVPS
ncbi:hypothetical protein SLE2022_352830 [Rubroshorea leprosula]